MSMQNGDWRSPEFRQRVIININNALKKNGSPHNTSAQEYEQLIFQKANNRESYMIMLARLILAFNGGGTGNQLNKGQLLQPVMPSATMVMDPNMVPINMINQEALKPDNTQILSKILQPSPVSNMSTPSPAQLSYQIPSPATVQPGKPPKPAQARTPQMSNQQVGSYPSPSPIIPSPSPVGHSPAPASSPQLAQSPSTMAARGSGIPSVESPGSFNPPSISNPSPQESPVKLSDKEEQLYVEKLKQLSVYTEPLRKMIAKMQNDEDKDSKNLTKLKRLLSILGNSKERVPFHALLKVENVLVRRLNLKTSQPPSAAPIGQSFLQALSTKTDTPQSNNTLFRMFGPTLATIYGPPICPPVAPKRRVEDQSTDTGLPQVVKCEIAQLANKFTISHNNDGNEECNRMTLVCSINDKTLPAVPTLSIRIPTDYPYSSPHCDAKDYESTAFLKKVKDRLEDKLANFSKRYSLTALLLNWESCLRHVNAKSGEGKEKGTR